MDVSKIRNDFPIYLYKPELVYLDSTATSLKPKQVIEKEQEYYQQYSANVHRGIYAIAEKATAEYEATRKVVSTFINGNSDEVIFTSGATDGVNIIASSMVKQVSGKEIVTTIMEHHSNFVPWQQLAKNGNAKFKVIPLGNDGLLSIVNPDGKTVNKEVLATFISSKTAVFAFTAVSNVLGTINPVKEINSAVRELNPDTVIVVDAAQAAPHTGINVKDWDADYVVFSAHKMLGPTGVGVLWGKRNNLEKMQPVKYGGEMVLQVKIEDTTFKSLPHKLEAGTPNIAGVIAFEEAIRYLHTVSAAEIRKHEIEITHYALTELRNAFGDGIKIFGPMNPDLRAGIITFEFENFHSHDVAQLLDEKNIAVRAGHHCTMPLHNHLDLQSSTRASFYIYTTKQDIDKLIEGLRHVKNTLLK